MNDTAHPPSISASVASRAIPPEQQAAVSRARILAKARTDHWPRSEDVGRAYASPSEAAARQRATRMRAAGELFGIWTPNDRAFYHPPFQFIPDGRVNPALHDLLTALAEIPTYAAAEDESGWGRIDWLLQPRWDLSERNLAYAQSTGGDVPDDEHLSSAARAPVDVFPLNAAAVIAAAHADALEIRGGR